MAYEGYLIKIGGLSLSGGSAESSCFIQGNTYDVSPNRIKVREIIDCNGDTHVVYSKKMRTTIEFETPKNRRLTLDEIETLQAALKTAQSPDNPNTYGVTYYNPRSGNVESGTFALDDLTYTVYSANEKNIFYAPMKFVFREVATVDL